MAALREMFKPEFLNRLDEIIVFHKLADEEIARIVDIMLAQLAARFKTIGIHISFTDKLRKYIKEAGTNLEYGARPLKRTIQKEIEDNMSEEILKGNIKSGMKLPLTQSTEKSYTKKIDVWRMKPYNHSRKQVPITENKGSR